MTAQLDFLTELTAPAPFDAAAWLWAQNPTPTRCDRCKAWTRTGDNYWGRCEAKQSWEHEYGKCERFERVRG